MTRLARFVLLVAASALLAVGCGKEEAKKAVSKPASPPAPPVHDENPNPPELGEGDEGGDAEEAPIVVTSPRVLDVVVGSFVLAGEANVFEANVSWELAGGPRDRVEKRGYVTATCGTGCRGKFKKTVSLKGVPPGSYTLFVFESSAKDGSHLHEVQVPLTIHATEDPDAPGVYEDPPGI